MDAINRFSIFVRGSSPKVYGVLCEANIVEEFAHLLSVILPLPTPQCTTMKHMCPLERIDEKSDYTAWMFKYGMAEDEEGEVGEGDLEAEDEEGEYGGGEYGEAPMDVNSLLSW